MDWNLLGHDWAVKLLCGQLSQKRLRHAYLITGPQGVGRRTLALRFGQAVNCPETLDPGMPCQQCKACVQIEHMLHPDLSVVLPEEIGTSIKVGQIRELQRSLALAPYDAKFRIALFPNFESATQSAQNALLKTLEEPPSQVILILTAENTDALLPTIISRCEIIRLRPIAIKTVEKGLVDLWNIPHEQAVLFAQISGGRPGIAYAYYQDPELLLQREARLDEHFHILHSDRVARFAFAEQLAKDKIEFQAVIQTWLSFWRDVLLLITRTEIPPANPDRVVEIEKVALNISLSGVRQTIESLEKTLQLVDNNINTRLAAEVLLIDFPTL